MNGTQYRDGQRGVEESRQIAEPISRATIEQRFLANSGLIVATRVVTAALSIVTIPILVAYFGVGGYGTWEALLALASLTSMFQLAVSGALVWRVSEAYGRGDRLEIRRLARLGAGVSLALFLLLWPIVWFVRTSAVQFLGVAPETQQIAAQMFPIVAGFTLLGGLSATLEAVVSGCQRTGLVNVVMLLAHVLNYVIVITLTMLGTGLWSLVAGQAAGFFARLVGAWAATRVSFGSLSLAPLAPGKSDLALARYSGLMIVGSIAAALRDQTDKIILASLASTAWVAYYGIAARLSSLVMEIISFVYVPMLTAVGALNAVGDWDGVRRLYGRLMTTVSVVTGVVVVVVAGLADRLVVLWFDHPIPEVTRLLWFLMTGSASAVMLTGPGTAICRGIGRVGIETTYLAVNLVLNIVLTISLVLWIGPLGTAVATGVTWALSSLLFVVLLHRNVDLPAAASRRAVVVALLAALVATTVYVTSSFFDLPSGRGAALLSVVRWGVMSALAYAVVLVSFRVVSLREAQGHVRSLLRRSV